MAYPDIRHCRLCGSATERRVPELEERERAVCPACGYIDYVNPNAVVGTIPVWWQEPDGRPRVLLCRRAIEPRRGWWTVPAGFQEWGESLQEGAVRETTEEAGARVEVEGLHSVLDVVHVGQTHVLYRARLLDLDLAPGPETLENALVPVDEIPWDELAFRTVERGLRAWVDDLRAGTWQVHTGQVDGTQPQPGDDA